MTVSVTCKYELQTSEISSKAINHSFNETLLVFNFFNFFRGERSPYINRTRVHLTLPIKATFSLFAKY